MEPLNLNQFEPIAREKISKGAYDYVAGGANDEITVRENAEAFRRYHLLHRVLVDAANVDTSTEVLGTRVSFPVLIAPVGSQGYIHKDGEIATSRAAAAAGTIFALSTTASYPIEEVAEAADGPKWFQLYFMGGREVAETLVRRAEAAGYLAICVTVDSPRHSYRERDLRNAVEGNVDTLLPRNFEQVGYERTVHYPSVTWKDIDWLRTITKLPILLKGVVRADDTRTAIEHGVSAVVVSNHGGRQLDTDAPTLDALPAVVEAADGKLEVLLDGGVRRGTDVLKALALGARAVLIGRPVMWGLGADGEAGVRRVLELLRNEVDLGMALAGCRSVSEIDASMVRRAGS